MKPYFIKTPNWIQKLFKNWAWSFSNSTKKIYLTFDDGPTPEITEWTLNTLDKFNAKATFFCIGKNVQDHPKIFERIQQKGHTIGNHTQNHLNGWKTTTQMYIENVEKAEKQISNKVKPKTKLFRPPYGKLKLSQAKNLRAQGYKIIMWDVLSADFDISITNEKCLNNVLNNTSSGSIVIFHDSVKAAENLKYVLPKVLAHFIKKGFEFKAITH